MANIVNNKLICVDYATTTNLPLIAFSGTQYRLISAGALLIDGIEIGIGDIILFKDQIDLTLNIVLQLINIVEILGDLFYYFEIPNIAISLYPKDVVYILSGNTQFGISYLMTINSEILTFGASEITWLIYNSDKTGSTVFGEAPSIINALARFDDVNGTIIKNSDILVDNAGNFSGAIITNATNTVATTILKGATTNIAIDTVDAALDLVLKATANNNAEWQTIGTAPTSVNAIVRWSDTGATLIKNSTILIDDTGEITNATITSPTNDIAANKLKSANEIVVINSNTPINDSFLRATSPTTASWSGNFHFYLDYDFTFDNFTITSTTFTLVGQIPFDLSLYQNGSYGSSSFINNLQMAFAIDGAGVDIQIFDFVNTTILASASESAVGPVFRLFNLTIIPLPVSDTLIQLFVRKSEIGGTNPILYCSTLNYLTT